MLELNDIQNLEVIDLNDSGALPKQSSVLDEINNEGISGKISKDDKEFFKDIFDQVNDATEPKGKHFVEKKSSQAAPVNNFERQFP